MPQIRGFVLFFVVLKGNYKKGGPKNVQLFIGVAEKMNFRILKISFHRFLVFTLQKMIDIIYIIDILG